MTEAKGDKKTSSLQKLFAASKVEAVHASRNKVLALESNENPQAAFKKLIESHVLSAPVRDSKTGKWTGFLDVRDLVAYAVQIYDFEEKKEQTERKLRERSPSRGSASSAAASHGDNSPRSRADDFLRLVLSHDPTEKATMYRDPTEGITVKYLAARNKFVPVSADSTVEKIAEVLAHGGVPRVPVVDKEGKIVDIISQSAIIKFIQTNESKLSDVLSQSLESLGLAHKTVVSVKDTDSALAAFRIINSKGLQGLAVVDNDGKIVGNTSASDVKLFVQSPSYRILNLPVIEYLNVIRRQSLLETVPVVSVKPDDTLGKAVAKLAATGMHRIFVVDAKHRPVGVVSIGDILSVLVAPAAAAEDKSAGDAKAEIKVTKS